MKHLDASDVLIVVGSFALVVGLYFIAWPLVLVVVGAAMTGIGIWRS